MSKRLREWRLSRARAARAEMPAAPPDPAEQFAKQAHNLDAVRKSVEDAAAVSAGFWLSYLFVLLYIAIAAGAVTHRDFLLENPVKLPFLNIELPLVAFFVVAPILFIVSHANTLVHFVMLGAKVGVFDTELLAQLGDAPKTSEGLRRQLPSNIFVQFLAGPRDIRKGGLGLILKAIAWFSLVIGPVLLLLLIQVQFLPYHLEWVTWVQQFAVLADVILLWLLWPAVLNGRSKLMWRLERRGKGWPGAFALSGRYIAGLTACLIPIGLAFTTATFPGEWLDEHAGNNQWIPPNGVTAWLGARDRFQDIPISTSFHDVLFNGKVDDVTWRRASLFSNTLVLPNFDTLEAKAIDDQKKLDWAKHTLVLHGRHLESAIFDRADLRKADLEGAQLRGASLDFAQLQGASLLFAELQGTDFQQSTFVGTNMGRTAVWRTNFEDARLTAVSEDGVKESALKKDEFAAVKAKIMKEVPEGERREDALKRIAKLNPDIFGPEASEQEALEKGRVDETEYKKSLAAQLKGLVCSGDIDAPYVVRGLSLIQSIFGNSRIDDTGAQAPGLVEAILKPNCPVSAVLTDADKAALKKIAKEASGAH